MTKATEFLLKAQRTIQQRGEDYDTQDGERSVAATVTAFNAITGQNIDEAEGWLFLQILKDVRQWSNPERYHADSAMDCVAYAALKAEALSSRGREYGGGPSVVFKDTPCGGCGGVLYKTEDIYCADCQCMDTSK
jgi:squalene cyclase